MSRIATVELEGIISYRTSAPNIIRSLENLSTRIISQLYNTTQMVFMRIINLVRLAGLFYINSY